MYFSKHNENITYINHYSGLLEVKGEGVLCREDTELWHKSSRNWAKEYDTLSVTEGITEIGEGYLEFFSHIDCIILSRTVESVAASSELLKLRRKKKVLLRGEYDTFAERFADENGSSDIHYNCFTPGSSAGSYGGGEYANPLPQDFYAGCTIEDFSNIFNERVREQILSNETLKRFLEISNERLRDSDKKKN